MSNNSKKKQPFTFRAIDVGYGRVKFTTTPSGTYTSFPSLAPRTDIDRTDITFIARRQTTNVWVEGVAYEIGPDTPLFYSEIPVLHGEYIETPEFRALVYGALDAMRVGRIDLLVTGLPVHQYASHSDRLKQLLKGTHAIRPGVCVEIGDVIVAAQPLGGLIAHLRENETWKREQDRTYLVVDPGYVTFDWLMAKGLSEIPGRSGSIPCGVSDYLTYVQEDVSRKLGSHFSNLHRIDTGLREGRFRIRGQEFDLQPFRARAEAVLDRAIRAMCNRVDAGEEIDQIVLVGGGSDYFLSPLKRAFPDHDIQVAKDPAYANVRGFHQIAKIVSAQQSKSHELE